MSKIDDDAYLKRTRATWIAGKIDVNFAKANAIMSGITNPSGTEQKKISKAIKEDMRSSLHKKLHK